MSHVMAPDERRRRLAAGADLHASERYGGAHCIVWNRPYLCVAAVRSNIVHNIAPRQLCLVFRRDPRTSTWGATGRLWWRLQPCFWQLMRWVSRDHTALLCWECAMTQIFALKSLLIVTSSLNCFSTSRSGMITDNRKSRNHGSRDFRDFRRFSWFYQMPWFCWFHQDICSVWTATCVVISAQK